ncbi:MAG: hypothetical protein HY331_17815 [Chloroflexi bacterium]|nr:hypothetical protein [Chloroflexota bacterium]
MAQSEHEPSAISPALRARLSPGVRIGAEWNAHRNALMPHQPPRLDGPIQHTTLSLIARRYPAGATGLGYTAGRVGETHLTPSQAKEGGVRMLGPGAAPLARQ